MSATLQCNGHSCLLQRTGRQHHRKSNKTSQPPPDRTQPTLRTKINQQFSLPSPVLTIAAVGQRVWVGTGSGRLYIFDAEDGRLLRDFGAAVAGVIGIAPAGSRCYTLAADGSMRGWASRLPSSVDTYAWCVISMEQKDGASFGPRTRVVLGQLPMLLWLGLFVGLAVGACPPP